MKKSAMITFLMSICPLSYGMKLTNKPNYLEWTSYKTIKFGKETKTLNKWIEEGRKNPLHPFIATSFLVRVKSDNTYSFYHSILNINNADQMDINRNNWVYELCATAYGTYYNYLRWNGFSIKGAIIIGTTDPAIIKKICLECATIKF